jgi:molybdate-binding protein/DNA-binding transcriptional regulator YhcF (GntR family)
MNTDYIAEIDLERYTKKSMDEPHLYKQIAESFRQEILTGQLKPGNRLPSVREVSEAWNCTVGTVQHAYQELARQGLVTSRAGQGTKVVEGVPVQDETPLRRAMLVHRAEAFLLEVLTAGYRVDEVEQAVRQALDRWRLPEKENILLEGKTLRFAGSHDLAITWLASHFPEIASGYTLQLNFTGSLGGLIALAEGKADLAGSHLWDEESDSYNLPFVRRLFPGKRVALVNLARRRLGLIVPAGNPAKITGLVDLVRPGLRFVNRQPGSGTRVWLDASLHRAGLPVEDIQGYNLEKMTHSAVAQVVAEDQADVGFGLEAAALSFGLDFIFLTHDRYDLVMLPASMNQTPVQACLEWLRDPQTRRIIEKLGGYDAKDTGQVEWVG